MKVKKKDWVAAKNQFEAMKINALINIECYQNNIDFIEEKLKEFPEEKEDAPTEVKEMISDITK